MLKKIFRPTQITVYNTKNKAISKSTVTDMYDFTQVNKANKLNKPIPNWIINLEVIIALLIFAGIILFLLSLLVQSLPIK